MLPRQILNLRSSEIAENVYFASCFCIFKAFEAGNLVLKKGALAESLKSGGYVPPVPPGSYVHA